MDPAKYDGTHIAYILLHILFVGAGAVGCFYASRLHHPSRNVYTSLTARSNYSAISTNGVTLQTHSFGNYTFKPHVVFPSVGAASQGARSLPGAVSPPIKEWDYVVVTTKALPDRSDDSELIVPLISSRTCIVLIQNGVGVEAPYRQRFPQTPIISAVTVVSAEQTEPGTIRQNRWTRMSLGPYGNGLEGDFLPKISEVTELGQARMMDIAHWWTAYGGIKDIETHTEVELQTIRWHKLCINAAFNPTAVVSGGRGNADQVRDSELREHILGIMNEIKDAAPQVLGQPFPASLATPERIIKSTERNTGAKPSMLLDWEAGRPMELEVILGNPVRIARKVGVEMPRLQSLYALLRSMQETREAKQVKAKI
ncbi:2-dehydropantoate 2-reductase [Xylariales sp. PMI_506]|nr:2-dehydropantoate 2-reductase [Xylariales sp. PMI_506]